MTEQKFVEYLNPKDGKTYLVTEKEAREIRLFSVRFLFVLSFALVLYLTNYFQLIYIIIFSILTVFVLEIMNFRFRVKLFSVRFPIKSENKKIEKTKYSLIRSIIYFIIGVIIIIYSIIQYGFKLEIYSLFIYAIGLSFVFQAYKFMTR